MLCNLCYEVGSSWLKIAFKLYEFQMKTVMQMIFKAIKTFSMLLSVFFILFFLFILL